MYQLQILDKMATVDDYEQGEVGDSSNFYVGETVTGKTIQEVIKKACDFVGGDYDGDEKCWTVDIDADQGRIDFQTLENGQGDIANSREIERWKQGEEKLWACYYVGYISEVLPLNLKNVKEVL